MSQVLAGRKKKMRAGFPRKYSLIKSIKKKTFQRKGALSHLKTVKKIFIKKKRVKSSRLEKGKALNILKSS